MSSKPQMHYTVHQKHSTFQHFFQRNIFFLQKIIKEKTAISKCLGLHILVMICDCSVLRIKVHLLPTPSSPPNCPRAPFHYPPVINWARPFLVFALCFMFAFQVSLKFGCPI